jgi:hypothetical protein
LRDKRVIFRGVKKIHYRSGTVFQEPSVTASIRRKRFVRLCLVLCSFITSLLILLRKLESETSTMSRVGVFRKLELYWTGNEKASAKSTAAEETR